MNGDVRPFERRVPNLGMVLNLPGSEVPDRAWMTARNVLFTEHGVQKMGGWRSLAAQLPDAQPCTLVDRCRFWDGEDFPVVGCRQRLCKLNGDLSLTNLNAELFTDASGTRWEAASVGNLRFYNRTDGLLNAKKYDGNALTDVGDLTEGPRGCHMTDFCEHLILGNLTNVDGIPWPLSFIGSGFKDPDDWEIENDESEATKIDVATGADPIQRILQLGDYLVAYKEGIAQPYAFRGGDNIYERALSPLKLGTVAPGSVIDSGRLHRFWGLKGLHAFDLVNERDDGELIWREFMKLVRADSLGLVYAVRDPFLGRIFWPYPSTDGDGTIDRALVMFERTGAFSICDFPFGAANFVALALPGRTLDEITETLAEWVEPLGATRNALDLTLLAGDSEGNLYSCFEPAQLQADDVDITSTLESGDTCYGDARAYKQEVGMVLDHVDAGANALDVYVGTRNSLADDLTWSGPYNPDTLGRVQYHKKAVWFRHRFVKTGGFFALRSWATLVRACGRVRLATVPA